MAAWVSWEDSDGPGILHRGLDSHTRTSSHWRVDPALRAAIPRPPLGGTPDRTLARHEAGAEKVQAAAAEGTVVVDNGNRGLSTWEGAAEGGVAFTAYLTIYCCLNDPGGAYCGLTASGVQVREGMAACSNHWPFGTVFIIAPGSANERRVVCQDRGSGVLTRTHLDVHFHACGDRQDPAPGTGWAWLQQTGTEALVEVLE